MKFSPLLYVLMEFAFYVQNYGSLTVLILEVFTEDERLQFTCGFVVFLKTEEKERRKERFIFLLCFSFPLLGCFKFY